MSVENRINSLADDAAVTLLQRFAKAQPRAPVPGTLDAAVAQQLRNQTGLSDTQSLPVTPGDLARAVLLLLATDPAHRVGIDSMLSHPEVEKFAVAETALIISTTLIALQTHLRLERDKHGKWSVLIEKKPTSNPVLRAVIQKLLGLQ